MLVIRSTAISSFVLAAALAMPAAAQDSGKQCSVDEGKPSEVARAYLSISQVASAGADAKPEELEKRLAATVQSLTGNEASPENPVGHAYELGKVLVLWAMQPNVPLVSKRGTIGYTTNPEGTINLAAAVDSNFKIVEKAMPECASETIKWRSQKPWITLVNGSIQELNAGNVDSADAHAQWSLLFNDTAPYGYMVLAQVAQRRNQTDSAIARFQKTIAAAASDTLYNQVKWQSELNLGTLASNAASAATDPAAKAKYEGVAKSSFDALANDTTADASFRESARSALVKVNLALGDTTSAKAAYQAQLADPSKFTFNELIQAGVAASQVNDDDGARKLFGAAYASNPYHRDAISNYAIYLIRAQNYDSALVLVKRLQDVDPDGNNSRLATLTYAGLAKKYADLNKGIVARYKASKNAKLKQALTDSASLTTDSNSVYTELAVKANVRADSAPVIVAFTEFSNAGDKVTLAGTISNNTTSDKTYTMKVDFLDKNGGVVASQQQTVGPVPGQAQGRFSFTASAPGIAAFKYAPLDN